MNLQNLLFIFLAVDRQRTIMGLITTGDNVDGGVTVAQKTDNEAKESKTLSTRNSNRNPNYKNRPTQSKCDPTCDPFCIPFAMQLTPADNGEHGNSYTDYGSVYR